MLSAALSIHMYIRMMNSMNSNVSHFAAWEMCDASEKGKAHHTSNHIFMLKAQSKLQLQFPGISQH